MKIVTKSLQELPDTAAQIIQFMRDNERKFIAFSGEMGAGKTTLINEILKQMNVGESGSSPTFAILNEYFSVNYGSIYHFDFYRLEDEMEAFDIGIEEIFEEDAYIFVEWPERIKNLIPKSVIEASLTVEEDFRTIELRAL